jgi:GWxTD domain-containing protein
MTVERRLTAVRCLIPLIPIFFIISAPSILAQDAPTSEPTAYVEALQLLEQNDTIAALRKLRQATRDDPGFGPAYLRIGSILSARAGELEERYPERTEADRALRKAWDLMGDDPEVLLETGLLLRRQNLKGDAQRVLDRAWDASVGEADSLSREKQAELHYALGRIYEAWWDDWRDLVWIPGSAPVLSCSMVYDGADHWDAAVMCPESWAEQLKGLVMLADLKSKDWLRMVDHFRLTFAADSTRTDAGYRLLGHLAEAGLWDEYMDVVATLVSLEPDDPRPHLFIGLGLHEQGYDQSAEGSFQIAMSLLPLEESWIFNDVSSLLTEDGRSVYWAQDSVGRIDLERFFFASADPLFLTRAQERRIEHYARVAWAELKFGEPAMGERGWNSERGAIWVRYGRPWRSYQCCYGGSPSYVGRSIGGRREYWSYSPQGPIFVFQRQLTFRHARLTEMSKQVADDMSGYVPQYYSPRNVTVAFEFPHQIVRFRGSVPEATLVEFYASPPLVFIGAHEGSTIETGLFVFDLFYNPLWERRVSAAVGDQPIGLSYQFEIPAGRYIYGLEARRQASETEERPAARARDTLSVIGFPSGQLSVSDVLLADALRALVPRPTRRDDFRIWPNRTLRIDSGDPIHVYFEVYGLQTDADDLARFRVEFAVEDADQHNMVQRIAQGVSELFTRNDEQEPSVTWERTIPITDDRAVEYLTVELPEIDEGSYAVRVRITDLVSGASAVSERVFWVDVE